MEFGVLPEKYWKRHSYLLYGYDILRDFLVKADENHLSSSKIEFDSLAESEEFTKSEDVLAWLEKNNKREIAIHLFRAHTFFSLLSDFCSFIYESISCSGRKQITVAYSLLRKPIRDNLIYFEWLLAYPEEFFEKIQNSNSEEYDLFDWKKFDENKKIEIINKAAKDTFVGKQYNQKNFIYDLRFNQKKEISLQRIWNKCTHIVTKNKNYKTNMKDLNFIYTSEENLDEFWEYYYQVVPLLMAYTLEICEALFLKIKDRGEITKFINRKIRHDKFLYSVDKKFNNEELYIEESISKEFLNISEKHIDFVCDSCGKKFPLDKNLYQILMRESMFFCDVCGKRNDILEYIIFD